MSCELRFFGSRRKQPKPRRVAPQPDSDDDLREQETVLPESPTTLVAHTSTGDFKNEFARLMTAIRAHTGLTDDMRRAWDAIPDGNPRQAYLLISHDALDITIHPPTLESRLNHTLTLKYEEYSKSEGEFKGEAEMELFMKTTLDDLIQDFLHAVFYSIRRLPFIEPFDELTWTLNYDGDDESTST